MSKITFRQFLEDIDVDDSAYSGDDAQSTVDSYAPSVRRSMEDPENAEWKPLPVKFPEPGFTVLYTGTSYSFEYQVVLVDSRDLSKYKMPFGFGKLPTDPHRIVAHLQLDAKTAHLPSGSLLGVTTNVLSGSSVYRGSGMASMLYETLVAGGQVLFSSSTQTSGGRANWMKLIDRVWDKYDVAVVAEQDEAGEYLESYQGKNRELIKVLKKNSNKTDIGGLVRGTPHWLLVGTKEQLKELAYDRYENVFVIAPKGTLKQHLHLAIKV